ncbi:MAG TPA: hypothetical protein VK661_13595 [Planctomycetota bacterium]|nr:hypothetical protein [Planctomycetota bacterium]
MNPSAAGLSPAPGWAHGSGLTIEVGRSTASTPLDTATNKIFAFGIGFLLAVLTLSTQYIGTPTDILSRVAPVDFLCMAFLPVLFVRHRMRMPPVPGLLYLAAVGLALIPAFLFSQGPDVEVWRQGSAILMAFSFYLIGLTLGDSPALLRWLLAGLCLAVLAEGVVVYHDSLSSNLWFPDPMEHRVRGTFKTNGQLGAYGFCAAGLLVVFGSTLRSAAFRNICVASALVASTFVFFASRRTGMIAVFAWGALFTVLGWRFAGERFYKLFVGGFLAILLLLGIFWPQVESSFAGRRFRDAMTSLNSREGFIQDQLRDAFATSHRWFPFGFGVGEGYLINPQAGFEVHNGMMAVLIELGVLGFAGFMGMMIHPLLRRRWQKRSRDHELLGVLLTTTLLICFLFMFHNTLYRDRTFLLFLGVATAFVLRESGPSRDSKDSGDPRESWGRA